MSSQKRKQIWNNFLQPLSGSSPCKNSEMMDLSNSMLFLFFKERRGWNGITPTQCYNLRLKGTVGTSPYIMLKSFLLHPQYGAFKALNSPLSFLSELWSCWEIKEKQHSDWNINVSVDTARLEYMMNLRFEPNLGLKSTWRELVGR